MNELDRASLIPFGRRLLSFIERLARKSWLGLGLGAMAVIFVAWRWTSIDFDGLLSVTPLALVASAVAYGAGLVVLAQIPISEGVDHRRARHAALSAQVLKYVPGSIWQGQRLVVVGGLSSVSRFALGVLSSAAVSLAISGRRFAVAVGLAFVVVTLAISLKSWGLGEMLRIGAISVAVSLTVAASGALLAVGAGFDPWWSGREIAGAWGLGVLAVPVPAGLGVRELFLTLSTMPEAAAELGVVHRVVTLATDAVVGGIGLWALTRRK